MHASIASELIDQSTLTHLVQAGTIRTANLVGQPGGWEVVVAYGREQRALGKKRGEVRQFRNLETLINLLRTIGLVDYRVDASQYDPKAAARTNPAAAERLRSAHAASAYDKWFRTEVGQALAEADDPSTKWLSNDDVQNESAKRRAAWRKQAQATS